MSAPVSDISEVWIRPIFDAVETDIMASGWFERVNMHESVSSPGHGLTVAVWVQEIEAAAGVSGLAASSALLTVNVRCYSPMTQEPRDEVDPYLLMAVSALMRRWHDNFDFGLHPLVRNVDLLGELGTPLRARAGYIPQEGGIYRVITITLPIIVTDVWPQGS